MAGGESFEFTPHLGIVRRREEPAAQTPGSTGNAGQAMLLAKTDPAAGLTSAPIPDINAEPAGKISRSTGPNSVAIGGRDARVQLSRRDWIKELRARRKVLDAELKRLRALETERDEITRLIEAATRREPKTPAVKLLRQQNH